MKVGSGLHASSKWKIGSGTVQWADVGSATVLQVADVIEKHQLSMNQNAGMHTCYFDIELCM